MPPASAEHVVDRRDDLIGLEVAAAEPEAPRKAVRHVAGSPPGDRRIRGVPVGAPVLERLAHGGADLAQQRRIDRQRLVHPLQHRDPALAAQQARHEVAGERPEHGDVEDPDLEAAGGAQVVADRLAVGDHRSLARQDVLGIVQAVADRPIVAPSGELRVLAERPFREVDDVVEVEGALRRDALGVAVLVLDDAEHRRVVEVEHLRDAPALVAEHEALRRRRRLDDVRRVAEVLPHQLPLRQAHRLDDVTRQEPVLRQHARGERQLGDAVRDQVEVGGLLRVLGEELEEPRVVDGVIVVVAGVDVQGVLRHRPAGDVQHVGEPLADRGVERLVHVGDALAAREVRRAQADHAHPGGDRRRGVLAFGLEEDELAAVDVRLAGGHRDGPPLAHLGRGGDRVRARRLAGRGLHLDDRRAPVHCGRNAGIPGRFGGGTLGTTLHATRLLGRDAGRGNWASSTHTMAPVGHRAAAVGSASRCWA